MFELKERQGFISKWMDALNLSPIGLGDDPSESFVHGIISQNFNDRLASPGTFAPFHIGAGGLLWDYSIVLDGLEKRHDPAFGPGQNWRLSIYEVSTCPKGLVCLPGYRNYVHNMKPALLFDFHAYGAKKHHGVLPSSFTKLFVVPYDPNAWTEAQPDVAGLR